MLKNFTSIALFAFLTALSINNLFAQQKSTEHKVIVIEKSIDENGKTIEKKIIKQGEEAKKYLEENKLEGAQDPNSKQIVEEQRFKIMIKDENGEDKIIEWDGKGDMPDEMKVHEKLMDNGQPRTKKKIKVIKKQNGQAEEFEYNLTGDEELPEDVKSLLEENGVDLEMIERTVSVEEKGTEKNIKIITKGPNGEEVRELSFEGDKLPEDLKKTLKDEGLDIKIIKDKEGNQQITVESEAQKSPQENSKKAQLGVNISGHPKGAAVSGIVKGSSADLAGIKVGDVITKVNAVVISDFKALAGEITKYKVGDKVKISFLREGIEQVKEVVLKERKELFPLKTWEQVMKAKDNTEIEIEIEEELIKEKKQK